MNKKALILVNLVKQEIVNTFVPLPRIKASSFAKVLYDSASFNHDEMMDLFSQIISEQDLTQDELTNLVSPSAPASPSNENINVPILNAKSNEVIDSPPLPKVESSSLPNTGNPSLPKVETPPLPKFESLSVPIAESESSYVQSNNYLESLNEIKSEEESNETKETSLSNTYESYAKSLSFELTNVAPISDPNPPPLVYLQSEQTKDEQEKTQKQATEEVDQEEKISCLSDIINEQRITMEILESLVTVVSEPWNSAASNEVPTSFDYLDTFGLTPEEMQEEKEKIDCINGMSCSEEEDEQNTLFVTEAEFVEKEKEEIGSINSMSFSEEEATIFFSEAESVRAEEEEITQKSISMEDLESLTTVISTPWSSTQTSLTSTTSSHYLNSLSSTTTTQNLSKLRKKTSIIVSYLDSLNTQEKEVVEKNFRFVPFGKSYSKNNSFGSASYLDSL